MVRLRVKAEALVLIVVALMGLCERAFAVPGDYDGDGKADIAIIDADEPEDKTTVFVRKSSGGVSAYVFFPFGDVVIAGDFWGNGKTYPGIVSKTDSPQLEWRIKRTNGKNKLYKFGNRSDKVPNQGDLDCDGTADLVVVRKGSNGSRTWIAKLSSNPTVETTTEFGNTGDFIFTADMDNDGCSEIGVLSSSYVWSTRPFNGGTVTEQQWGSPGDYPLLPADLDGDDAPEYITARKVGNKLVAQILDADDNESTVNLGSTSAVPMVGDFLGGNNFGWFDRNNSRVFLIAPDSSRQKIVFGNPRRGLLRPDGTEVPEGKSGRFGTPSS